MVTGRPFDEAREESEGWEEEMKDQEWVGTRAG
jgi:hypothetical protein